MQPFVDLRAPERSATFAAFAALLLLMAGHTLLETARDALFLAKLPAEQLPFMYLAIAAAGLLVMRLADRLGGQLGLTLVLSAAITLGFYGGVSAPGATLLYALFIWSGTIGSWLVLQFWLLMGQTFHVGQAKRLFGFIGGGGVLGATLGALGARVLSEFVTPRVFLLASALLLGLAIVPVSRLAREARQAAATRDKGPTAAPKPTVSASLGAALREVLGADYLRRILLLAFATSLCLTVVDYLFKSVIAASVPKEDLGRTFAGIYTVLNGAALVVQLGLVGVSLRFLGAPRALMVLPLLVLTFTLGVAWLPTLGAALLLKGVDGVLRHSLNRTATELLSLPMADAVRKRAKPVIDLVSQRGGQALASLGILLAVALGAGTRTLALAAAGLALGWLVIAARLGKPYLEVFRRELRQGRIDPDAELPELDLGALETLFAALNSPKDSEVLGALDLLAAQRRQRLVPALVLYHPSPEVVLRALAIFSEQRRDDFLPITDRLFEHADPRVRAAALRARLKVAYDPDFVAALLADPERRQSHPELLACALVAQVSRGAQGGESSRATLRKLLLDEAPEVRIALLSAMTEEPCLLFAELLLEASGQERDRRVQLALAGAMGAHAELDALERQAMIERLLPWLPLRGVGHAARSAMARLVRDEPRMLDPYLDKAESAVRGAIPRVLELAPPKLVTPLLMEQLDHHDGLVRFRALKALKKLRRDVPELELDQARLTKLGLLQAQRALSLIRLRLAVEAGHAERPARSTAAGQLLLLLLRDKTSNATARLFLVLGLLIPGQNFDHLLRAIHSGDKRARASARELCESLVKAPLRDPLSWLTEDLDDAERMLRARGLVDEVPDGYEALLLRLTQGHGELAALAHYHARELELVFDEREDGANWGAFAQGLGERAPLTFVDEVSHGS